jgi:hypothetical protein
MAKDKGTKGASKKGKQEPRNWAKTIIPLFLVFIMLGTVVAYVAGSNWGGKIDNDRGSKTKNAFGGVADALSIIPAESGYARYIDLRNDTELRNATNSYTWLKGSLPPVSILNADPQTDLFAIYPSGYFSDHSSQFVSLTDFGTAAVNKSWPDSTGSDYYHELLSYYNIAVKKVNDNYYYTPSTYPVISGKLENVAPTGYVMASGNTSLSSYGKYKDLFDELKYKQISTDGMTLEMVGLSSNLSYSDRYYAGIRPLDASNASQGRLYSYVVIMHVNNTTVLDNDRGNLALLQGMMEKSGFVSYNTQVYDDYVVIEAKGTLVLCLEDMYYRWGFIKYQSAL